MSQEEIQRELTQPYGTKPPPTWHWGPQESHPARLDWGPDPPDLAFDGTHCLKPPMAGTEQRIAHITSQASSVSMLQTDKMLEALSSDAVGQGWLKGSAEAIPASMRMSEPFGKVELLERLALRLDTAVTARQHAGATFSPVHHYQDMFQPKVWCSPMLQPEPSGRLATGPSGISGQMPVRVLM